MDFTLSETSKVKKSLLYDGFAFRIDRVLKSGDISWQCTVKNCKGRIKTDEHFSAIINGNCNHTHDSDSRKIQKQIIRAVVKRKAASDITTCSIKLVRCALLSIEDECLQENDLKSLTMSIYRQRRKEYPALPKSREEVHNCMEVLELQTNKNEQFCLTNSKEHGIIILSCGSNPDALCQTTNEIFIDGTFKFCSKYFEQLYTIHGFKLRHYVPLVFALLPSKTEAVYTTLLQMVSVLCQERQLDLRPSVVHIGF